MSENTLFPPTAATASHAHVDNDTYLSMYDTSINNNEAFWAEHGKRIDWIKPYTKVENVSYDADNLSIKWYEDGTLNAAANCLDRHLAERGDQVAIIFEGDEPTDSRNITYRELHEEVSKFANVLKARGVKKVIALQFICR